MSSPWELAHLYTHITSKVKLPFSLSGTETSNFESPLGDDTLPQDRDIPERGAMEAPTEGLMLLEGEEEGGSGSEDAPEEEGHVKSDSALEEVDKDFQCPKEEDTITLEGIPGCKTCRLTLVPTAMEYNQAHYTCLNRYRGFLVSIHSFTSNYRIQRLARSVNQGKQKVRGQCPENYRWDQGHREMPIKTFNFWSMTQIGESTCLSLHSKLRQR
uniref:Uncharacterized protein n=1 Tax=Equus asinus asinus TaxID=83772 RepID=A0A8C4M5Z8_EQUAS